VKPQHRLKRHKKSQDFSLFNQQSLQSILGLPIKKFIIVRHAKQKARPDIAVRPGDEF
jgi:hypothetical protein